jgi:hypothetical protein
MAEVIHIRAGEKVPGITNWVLLERTPAGRYAGTGSVARAQNVTFQPLPTEGWDTAISRAIAWADRHGISVVHVRGREHDA